MKSVVLLSAGLDSTVNLALAKQAGEVLLALTFDYGQRAAQREIAHAKAMCSELKISHQVVELPWLKAITRTALVNRSASVPTNADVAIDDLSVSTKTAAAVWVPNRNGAFLNIAAGFAESLGADTLVPGFNLEEATTFPDNSEAFLRALDKSFEFSTMGRVKTHCYTTELLKPQIVELGLRAGAPLDLVWSCYFDGLLMCGECESCQRFYRAIEVAQVSDIQAVGTVKTLKESHANPPA